MRVSCPELLACGLIQAALPCCRRDFDCSAAGATRVPPFFQERLPGKGPGVTVTQAYDMELWEATWDKE
jgi:hypothetical protein